MDAREAPDSAAPPCCPTRAPQLPRAVPVQIRAAHRAGRSPSANDMARTCTKPAAGQAPATGSRNTTCTRPGCARQEYSRPPSCARLAGPRNQALQWPCRRLSTGAACKPDRPKPSLLSARRCAGQPCARTCRSTRRALRGPPIPYRLAATPATSLAGPCPKEPLDERGRGCARDLPPLQAGLLLLLQRQSLLSPKNRAASLSCDGPFPAFRWNSYSFRISRGLETVNIEFMTLTPAFCKSKVAQASACGVRFCTVKTHRLKPVLLSRRLAMPARERMAAQPCREPLEETLAQGHFHEIQEEGQNQPVRPKRLTLAHHGAFVIQQLIGRRVLPAACDAADFAEQRRVYRLGLRLFRFAIKTSVGQNQLRT